MLESHCQDAEAKLAKGSEGESISDLLMEEKVSDDYGNLMLSVCSRDLSRHVSALTKLRHTVGKTCHLFFYCRCHAAIRYPHGLLRDARQGALFR